MICAAPLSKGPNRGKPATGSWAGYQRHRRSGEPACEACQAAAAGRWKQLPKPKANREKRKAAAAKYKLTGPQFVYCSGCGARGTANRAIVGRSRVIESCVNCKDAA